jgi:hypothetical protein
VRGYINHTGVRLIRIEGYTSCNDDKSTITKQNQRESYIQKNATFYGLNDNRKSHIETISIHMSGMI